ncbi:hypothetical protein F5879DRAFT_1037914 [Lentinula edodes]|nr:hypothetical protein F5879DRAFT_1037914 [Lentinula edodes]
MIFVHQWYLGTQGFGRVDDYFGSVAWTQTFAFACLRHPRLPNPSLPLSLPSPQHHLHPCIILPWFLDTPSELAPFSVHWMALAGKDLGKDVGMWFGPSTAAGAIRSLVHAYSDAGLGVAVATDGLLTQTDVYAASHGTASTSYPRRGKGAAHTSWGDRPVLVLFGIRLGLDGVNPIYYDTIKMLYTFPQSVGIAGGRPSLSYYFVSSQTDNLFYLDPHHARPAVPLRLPPTIALTGPGSAFSAVHVSRPSGSSSGYGTTEDAGKNASGGSSGSRSYQGLQAMSGSPSSTRTGSSFHTPLAPSPLQQQYSRSPPVAGNNGASLPHAGSYKVIRLLHGIISTGVEDAGNPNVTLPVAVEVAVVVVVEVANEVVDVVADVEEEGEVAYVAADVAAVVVVVAVITAVTVVRTLLAVEVDRVKEVISSIT